MVFGLSPEFFDGLKKHHGKLPKERKSIVSSFPQRSPALEDDDDESESEDESAQESEADQVPVAPAVARGGRGGRGSRGRGRGRGGGRGRGRGGRPRGGATRGTSSARGRSSRNLAMVPLAEEDDGDEAAANQDSPRSSARLSPQPPNDEPMGEPVDSDMENAIEDDGEDHDYAQALRNVTQSSTTNRSPPHGDHDLPDPAPDPDLVPAVKTRKIPPVPKIKLPTQSASQTPRASASNPAAIAVPKLLAPEDDVLSESDLPEPWIEDPPPVIEADCEDRADYLLQTRFQPMVDVQEVIATLTKYQASQRSTESLFALAANTQKILQEFQDQFLMLDARTAPHMNPAKKACNGGRIPLAQDVFEDMKEADLYGYTHDPKKVPGAQDPWGQRAGAEKSGGRELRTRRNRDMLDSAPVTEDEDDEDNEGRPAKRQRKATRKFDGSDAGTGASTPKKHSGWGGARKKGVSRFANTASETPEPESRPAKRARIAASNLLHQRIQEMREASLISGSGDEESSAMDVDDYSDSNAKRGRPAGSKNVARRSDFGVKKGPRKRTSEAGTPVPSAHGPNTPPLALQSMSDGQGQFSIAPQPHSEALALVSNSAEAAFQATPHPQLRGGMAHEAVVQQPEVLNTPDSYMITAPLSQYTGNYAEDSSPASGSRRKPRVKSEKRSQSMTIWWAERKARKKEQDEKNGTPAKDSASRRESINGRRGGRGSTGSAPAGTPSAEPQRPPSMHQHEHQHSQPLQEAYPHYAHPPTLTGPSPLYMYASAPPPPPGMMMQYSPLAAIPSGAYPFSGPPALNSQYGPRALAPAPMLQHAPAYPSPYGPQSPVGARPKSSGQAHRNGPPPLAPAPPQHFSPYAPVPFKVMIPPASSEPRRDSR
jgi:hypothetical protein